MHYEVWKHSVTLGSTGGIVAAERSCLSRHTTPRRARLRAAEWMLKRELAIKDGITFPRMTRTRFTVRKARP